MKICLLMLAVVFSLGCHSLDGPCCSNADCPGNYVCSTSCNSDNEVKGNCLAPCQVDKDCNLGQVCNLFALSCGCDPIGDAGPVDGGYFGSCSGNVGN